MATIDYTTILPGDTLNAASLNDRFTAIEGGVNEIELYGIRERALNSNHLPSLVPDTAIAQSNLTVSISQNVGYANAYPGFNVDPGWAVLNNGAGTNLQLTFNGFRLGMSETEEIAGFLVLLNLNFTQITWAGRPALPAGPAVTFNNVDFIAAAIQWQDSPGGFWRTLSKTERFMEERPLLSATLQAFSTDYDIAIRTFISVADTGATDIQGIRGVVALDANGGGATAVQVRQANLSAIPIHAEIV